MRESEILGGSAQGGPASARQCFRRQCTMIRSKSEMMAECMSILCPRVLHKHLLLDTA